MRAAAVQALAADPDSRLLLRARLADDDNDVRAAAVQALAADPDSKHLLRERLADSQWNVRAAAIKALAADPESRHLIRDRLGDPQWNVRAATFQALAAEKAMREGYALKTFASPFDPTPPPTAVRLALRVAGVDPTPSAPTSDELLQLEERLSSYLRAPRLLHLDAEPELGSALIAWLLVRLGWGSPSGELGEGNPWGELPAPFAIPAPAMFLLRVAMLDTRLPAERRLHPHRNLTEAYEIARQLRTTRPLTLFLACGDVPFEDLVPPTLDPGQVHWGPTFYGFRLSEAPISMPDEAAERFVELLVSRDPVSIWRQWDAARRAAALKRLGVLANQKDVDARVLAPLFSRLGPELPEPLRRSLAHRLPPQPCGERTPHRKNGARRRGPTRGVS